MVFEKYAAQALRARPATLRVGPRRAAGAMGSRSEPLSVKQRLPGTTTRSICGENAVVSDIVFVSFYAFSSDVDSGEDDFWVTQTRIEG